MEDYTTGRDEDENRPESPPPENSGLTLEEYLDMQRAIGYPIRYQLFNDAVDVASHNFHCHLDELVDVGLIDRRQRRTPDSSGFYTYFGRVRWDAGSSSTASTN